MHKKVTLDALLEMKQTGQKIVAVVVYDYQMAQIADRAGVDLVSVGDSVGVNLWGHATQAEVTVDQMVLVCQAVRRGVGRALVSCDLPLGPLENGTASALGAAVRLIEAGGADLVKLDGAASHPEAVTAITRAGIAVWAQFGLTPYAGFESAGANPSSRASAASTKDRFVDEAKHLEKAGASMLDFTHSGPIAGPEVVRAVGIPVLGGLGGGPWLDGRVRSLFAAIGYSAAAVGDETPRYANVAEIALTAINAFSDDVRAGRQIRGSTK